MKNKLKCTNAYRMLTVAVGDPTVIKKNYKWFFFGGREYVSNDACPGRLRT